MLLLDTVVASCVIVLEFFVLVIKPLKCHWNTILFIDCIFDVNDLCLCGDVIHCDGLATERLDKDLLVGMSSSIVMWDSSVSRGSSAAAAASSSCRPSNRRRQLHRVAQ